MGLKCAAAVFHIKKIVHGPETQMSYRISMNSFHGNYSFFFFQFRLNMYLMWPAENIQGRKLFKAGIYSKKYGMQINDSCSTNVCVKPQINTQCPLWAKLSRSLPLVVGGHLESSAKFTPQWHIWLDVIQAMNAYFK